ncbi:MAG: PAS domain S-box protein [Gaiellaceae bacterium]
MRGSVRPELEVAALSGEVDAVMRGIVERLMRLPHADGASLSTIDDEFAYFRVCAGEDVALQGRTFRLEETLGATCLDAGDLTVLRKTTGPEVDRCLTAGAASIALAPLEWDGRVRGILGVRSTSLDAFDDAGVEEIRMLAAGASIALRNAEVIAVLAASERHYRELHDQAADAILVTDGTGRILDANEAAAALLWRPVEELLTMRADDLFTTAELAAAPPRGEELAQIGELRSERPFLRKDGAEIMVEYSCRVLGDGRVHTSLRDVTQRKRNEERLRSSLGRLHAIVQTQQEISALELDRDAVTSTIVLRAQRLCGGDGATVQWFDGHESVFHHCSGIAAGHVGLRLDRSSSLAGTAALSGEAVYAGDTDTDSRADSDACARLGARSLICAPLYREGRVAGVLSVMGREPHAFDELAIETARLMAEFVSAVMRNTAELEERRLLVEELRTQEQVVEHMQTALWVWSVEGETLRLDYANRATELATGLRVDQVLGRAMHDVLPAVPEELTGRLLELVDTGELFDAGELEYADERIAPSVFSVKAFPLSGRRLAVTFDDVTEVSRSRRALQESEASFRSAFDASALGMALETIDGRFIGVNDRLAELLGYEKEELARLDVRTVTHPSDLAESHALLERLSAGEVDAYTMEKRYLRKDGTVLLAEVTASAVRGADGRPTGIVGHVRDVTRQKELEAQLRQAQKMEAVGRLAGGIAHDFNNLLTAISGYSEFLIGGVQDPKLGRYAEEIKKAAARAASLTGQLLAFSRRQVLQPRVLDLNATVSDMDMMLRRLIGEDVELVTMLDPEPALVLADPTQIEQVIVNLAVNARDAMPHGGSVTIETAQVATGDGVFVELRMTDTGVGMTDAERQQLFDPFFTTKAGGTGLGLATVYGIVEQSGGAIEVESAPGLGSSFRILLPTVAALVDDTDPEPAEHAPADGEESILLVEDEAVVRQLVAESLESNGYTVLQAGDGPSALELLRRHTGEVDLLVTDVVMPGMSGPEVAAAVAAMRPGTQVLYISGYTDSAIDHHGVLEPGIAFLQKPFGADDLARKVREVLDGAAAPVD